jgi:hypothetical protein
VLSSGWGNTRRWADAHFFFVEPFVMAPRGAINELNVFFYMPPAPKRMLRCKKTGLISGEFLAAVGIN